MNQTGGCYCGAIRYEITAEPIVRAQCHCRECQYFSGGAPSPFLLIPKSGFAITMGRPQTFARSDIESPVTRQFCGTCGTLIVNQSRDGTGMVVRAGTLDDPTWFEAAQLAIFTKDAQPFHEIPEDLPAFETLPSRR